MHRVESPPSIPVNDAVILLDFGVFSSDARESICHLQAVLPTGRRSCRSLVRCFRPGERRKTARVTEVPGYSRLEPREREL